MQMISPVRHACLSVTLLAILFVSSQSGASAADQADIAALVEKTHQNSLAARERVLRKTVARDSSWPSGNWGEVLWSLAALYLNERVDDANDRLLQDASEYIAARKAQQGASSFLPEDAKTPWTYFALTDYVRILHLFHAKSPHFPGRLEKATEAAMKEALWCWIKSESTVAGATLEELLVTLGTENHDLTLRPNYYLIAALLADDPAFRDRRYDDGHTAAEHTKAYASYFQRWAGKRVSTGLWIEVGSNGYQKYSWPALFNLHELAPDPLIRKRFGMLLDLAFIEEAQISVRGRRGGGRSRAYGGKRGFESYKNLLYAPEGQPSLGSHSNVIETSRYQLPAAAILLRFREFPAKEPFVIRNRVLGELEFTPMKGDNRQRFAADSALVNYAYRTPHYLLGSTLQDPTLTNPDLESERGADWKYSGISRQNRSFGMLFDDPASDTVSEVYPVIDKTGGGRPQHSFWSAQHENVLILQRIAPQTRKRMGSYNTGSISIRYDGPALKHVEENGWIFSSNGKAFLAVKFLDGGHKWIEDAKEAGPVKFDHSTDSSRVLMHAGDLTAHASFDHFRKQVQSSRLAVAPDKVDYEYGPAKTRLAVTLFDVENPEAFKLPEVNGKPIDMRPPVTWQSPYLNGRFGSEKVTVTAGSVKQVLDFSTGNNGQ